MFQSQTMNKVELVVPEHDIVTVTEALAASGVFHSVLTRARGMDQNLSGADQWEAWAGAFSNLEHRILGVMEALEVAEGQPPDQTPHLIEPEIARRDVEHLEQEAEVYVHELEEEQRRLARLQRYVDQLEPLVNLNVDIDTLRNLEYTFMQVGTIPVDNIERFRTSLEHLPHVLLILQCESYLATVALFGARRDEDILERAARSAYLNALNLPDQYRGTPAEALEALRAGIARIHRHIEDTKANIQRLHEKRVRHLHYLLWRVRASRKLVETISRYERLHYTYVIQGWVPRARLPELRERVLHVSEEVLIEVTAPSSEETQHIPASLENPPFLKSFQSLVTNYGYPTYNELDPTPVLALTFPFVFGLMFGDVGHGLLLILVGILLASGKIRALRGLKGMGAVVAACGFSATFFGFLFGSLFGFEGVLPALWLQPLEEISEVLVAAIGAGAVILSIGMFYNMANAVRNKAWGRVLFDHNGFVGVLFYWSLLGWALTNFGGFLSLPPLLFATLTVISGLGLAFSEMLDRLIEGERPLIEESMGTYLMQAFFELFETLIGLLSNTLSYVRMGAFAVAHGALSMVVFIMAELVGPERGLGYWMTVILGNLFVIGFEGMIVGIQTLRLEYYEFFSKFFSGNGVRFSPLSLVAGSEE
jgi:V/A-type H+-transporting ATPase subunit I